MVAAVSTHLHRCCNWYRGTSPLSFLGTAHTTSISMANPTLFVYLLWAVPVHCEHYIFHQYIILTDYYFYLPEENLFQVIMDLFVIGTDTTAGALRWLLLYLIHNPDIQQKCQNEIHEVHFFKNHFPLKRIM